MWLEELQIALAEQDPEKIEILLNSMPAFEKMADMQSASYLLKDAFELMTKLKEETSATMKRVKKNREFLQLTEGVKDYKLDITS